MTTWHAPYVVSLARRAGWAGDDLAPAVAMALASSKGADHYVSNVIGGEDNERRGLWALTAAEAAPVAPHRLWHPGDNARAAYGRWAANGGAWGWHPVWWGPLYEGALVLATGVIEGRAKAAAEPTPSWAESVARVQAISSALHHRLTASA